MEDFNANDYKLFGPMPRLRKWLRTGGTILGVLIVLWIGAGIYGSKPQAPVAQAATDNFVVAPEIVALGQKIGVPLSSLQLTHAQIGSSPSCDSRYFVACFVPSTDTIYLSLNTFTSPYEDPATTLAYEFAHFAWKITPDDERAEIIPAMNQWYLAHKTIVDRTQSNLIRIEGGFGSANFEDELHSITCTEVADNELAPELLAHCSAFLPNRSALRNLY